MEPQTLIRSGKQRDGSIPSTTTAGCKYEVTGKAHNLSNRMRTPDPPPLIERNIMGYPIVGETVELLLSAAARAAEECASEHPEDIAFAMAFAIENVGPAIMDAYNKFGKQ